MNMNLNQTSGLFALLNGAILVLGMHLDSKTIELAY